MNLYEYLMRKKERKENKKRRKLEIIFQRGNKWCEYHTKIWHSPLSR